MSYTPPLDGFKPSLFRKIAEVQGEIHAMRPDETVTTDKYSFTYISESQLLEAVRARLSSRHVAAFVSVDSQQTDLVEAQRGRGSDTYTVTYAASEVTLRIVFADGESGETFTIYGQGRANDAGDKSVYKAITSANRYAWWKTMLVPTDDDDVNKDSGRGDAASTAAHPVSSPPGVEPSAPNNSPFTPPAPRTQPTDGGDPLQVVITFGKYKLRTIGEVQAENEGYLRWLIDPEKYQPKTVETRRIVGAAAIALGMAVPAAAEPDADIPF